jgi:acetyl esterase/lipase
MKLSVMIGLLGAALFALAPSAFAADPQVIPVWNGVAPGSESWAYSEEQNISQRDKSLNLRNIVHPTLTVYPADPAMSAGTGVIVIPGGGYVNLGYGKEGEEVAHWLNSIGVTAFVLKYRLARTGDADAKDPEKQNARIAVVAPLAIEDAKQAMRIVRSRAAEWGLKHIGIIGFSAGGYLAVCAASQYDGQTRPDFVAAIYAGSPPGLTAPADAPAMFLALAADDPYVPRDSFGTYAAWNKAHIPVEMHVYAKGGHGFALHKQGLPVDGWNERFRDWLASLGMLQPAAR